MLKRKITRHLLITTAGLFTFICIALFPAGQNNTVGIKYVMEDQVKEHVYLLNDRNMLCKTEVIIESNNLTDKVIELLDVLIKDGKKESSIPNGLSSYIPSDTLINGVSYLDKIVTIDFSENFISVDKELELSIIEGIVYTLTELEDISGVSIMVDGNLLTKLPQNNIWLPTVLTRDFGINKEYNITSLSGINSVVEYYVHKHNENSYYVPVTKYVNDNRDKIKIIIEDLVSSNTYMTDLLSFINSNTKLLDYEFEEDKLKLIFNEYILNDFDTSDILEEVTNMIMLSIKDNYDVSEVVFYVSDKEIYKSSLKSIE